VRSSQQDEGKLPLRGFSDQLRLKDFFKEGDTVTLQNLLEFLKKSKDITSFGRGVSITAEGDQVTLERRQDQSLAKAQCQRRLGVLLCHFAVEVINSDDTDAAGVGLQPRYLIYDKVFDLYRHFQNHPYCSLHR